MADGLSTHTTPRGRTLLTLSEMQRLDKHALLTLVKTGAHPKAKTKAAALNFLSEDQLRQKLVGGGFTVSWSRVAAWIRSPPDPTDAPVRGLALREWNMDRRVLALVKSGQLSLMHMHSPASRSFKGRKSSVIYDQPNAVVALGLQAPSLSQSVPAVSRPWTTRRAHSCSPTQHHPHTESRITRAGSQPLLLMGPPLDLGRLRELPPGSSDPPHTHNLPPPPEHAPHPASSQLTVHLASSQVTSTSRSSTPSPPQRVTFPASPAGCRSSTANCWSVPSTTAEESETVTARPLLADGHGYGGADSSSHRDSEPLAERSQPLPESVPVAAETSSHPRPDTDAPGPASESLCANTPGAVKVASCTAATSSLLAHALGPEHKSSNSLSHDDPHPVSHPAPVSHPHPVSHPDPVSASHPDPVSHPHPISAGHDAVFAMTETYAPLPRSPATLINPSGQSPLGAGVADFLASLRPATIRDSGSERDALASNSEVSYLTEDNDSDEARDDPEEPGLDLIINTLETYKFEDARYHPSDRDSSPPSTRPSSRASSEAETDYAASFDLDIRPEHGLKKYRRLLARAKQDSEQERNTLFDDSETGHWPEALLWRGCGDVAALGEDRTVTGNRSHIVDVLYNVQLYFDRRRGVFTVSSTMLVDLLINSIMVQNVCGYIGVPVKVGGMVRIQRLAFWDQPQGQLTSVHTPFNVELFVVDPKRSSRALRQVLLGVKYVVESGPQVLSPPQPLRGGVSSSVHPPARHPDKHRLHTPGEQSAVSSPARHSKAPPSVSALSEYTSDERFQALQEWMYARFGSYPEYRSIRLATRQNSQHASILLQWVKFAKKVKDAGPVDDPAFPAAQGLTVTNAALGVFLNRGHDWIKWALEAQEAIESRKPAVSAVTVKLMTKGYMLGTKTLAGLCIAARDGEPLPAFPRRGRGKTGGAIDTDDDDESASGSGDREVALLKRKPKSKPKPKPIAKRKEVLPKAEDELTDRDAEGSPATSWGHEQSVDGDEQSRNEQSGDSGNEQSGNEQSGDGDEQSGDEQSGDGDEQSGSGDEQSGDGDEQSGDGDEQSGDGDEQSGDGDDGDEQSGDESGDEQSGHEQSGDEQSGGRDEQSGDEGDGDEQSGKEQPSPKEQSSTQRSGYQGQKKARVPLASAPPSPAEDDWLELPPMPKKRVPVPTRARSPSDNGGLEDSPPRRTPRLPPALSQQARTPTNDGDGSEAAHGQKTKRRVLARLPSSDGETRAAALSTNGLRARPSASSRTMLMQRATPTPMDMHASSARPSAKTPLPRPHNEMGGAHSPPATSARPTKSSLSNFKIQLMPKSK